mmetsp:Transcript_40759/g.115288  ORF Transcript_40759/g.115288 Transcript_40759/m.115288 type:complete len:284 (+) Transcript_40759:151-1002(+)
MASPLSSAAAAVLLSVLVLAAMPADGRTLRGSGSHVATNVADLSADPGMYCSPEQCGMNVTKCMTVPVKGEVCWDVACPPCGIPGRDLPHAAGLQAAAAEEKDDGKFGCLPTECDMVKETCLTVPVAGDICWNVTCPACKLAVLDTKPVLTQAVFKKSSADKKKDDADKKKFGCLPTECGMVKATCLTVPVAGDICWNVTCPACKPVAPDAEPAEEVEKVLFKKSSADKKKDDDDKKFGCLPEECGTDKEVCMAVPVVGDVCWNVACPACTPADNPDAHIVLW